MFVTTTKMSSFATTDMHQWDYYYMWSNRVWNSCIIRTDNDNNRVNRFGTHHPFMTPLPYKHEK